VTEAEIVVDNDVILDGCGELTVDGNDDHGVFSVIGVTAELRNFALAGGNNAPAISNSGTLVLTNSTVSESWVGISSLGGTLTLNKCQVWARQWGVRNLYSTLSVANSTVTGMGDIGILNCGGPEAVVAITHSTVSGNPASLANAVNRDCVGIVAIGSSIVDGGCEGDFVSNGHNIESPNDTCGFDQLTDQVNVTTEALALGPLADNGGPTKTKALLPASVAIDAIPPEMCEVDEDQRGEPRPGGTMCDVGAFEVQEGSL
jgi:hypothetical protein